MAQHIKQSLSSSLSTPLLLVYGVILSDSKVVGEFPHYYPYIGEWGYKLKELPPIVIPNGTFEFKFLWYSINEDIFFTYEKSISISSICDTEILWGFKLNGEIACWEYNESESALLGVDKAAIVDSKNIKHLVDNPDMIQIIDPNFNSFNELKEKYIDFFKTEYEGVIDNFNYSLDETTKLFNFKYNCQIKYYGLDVNEFSLNVKYYDGSFNKNEKRQFDSGPSPIPQRLNFRWDICSIDYNVCFFFNFIILKQFFNRFYGAHPETKTDFIIRIDAENKKYELALYRQGLKEPVVIPESAYQLIVFKNKFEDYRSENYNQPRGAWIW